MAQYAWLVPLLPAVSALLILAFGKRLAKGGALIGVASLSLSFVIAVAVAVQVFSANVDVAVAAEEAHHAEGDEGQEGGVEAAGEQAAAEGETGAEADENAAGAEHGEGAEGAAAGAGEHGAELPAGIQSFLYEAGVDITGMQTAGFEAGLRVDGLTAMMFLLVTFVSLMVHIYSLGYMDGDPRFTWFYAMLSIFTMSMLLLVISNNLMVMLVGWELVGVCSFLLIGFWWEEKVNSSASIKAFLTTKFGDVGLVVAVAAGFATELVGFIPATLLNGIVGLAVLGILAQSLQEITKGPLLLGPLVAFGASVSNIEMLGLGRFFWALVLGIAASLLLERSAWRSITDREP